MPSIEKKRKHKHSDEKSKKKHKSSGIVHVSHGKDDKASKDSAFSEVSIRLYVHLAPMWNGKTMDGVNETLNAFLMKYVAEVDGIVLAHSDVELQNKNGQVLYDSPFCHFFITAKLLVWRPKKGSKLVGRISLQSQDHVGLLIYGTFNASIPRSNLSEKYEWSTSENHDEDEEEQSEDQETRNKSQNGEWVTKSSGARIGGDDGSLEFTVVDITEVNDILTVTGSL
ncbi:hypothetical protein DM01DRAFT_1309926 [Hesseltinella vesiculosa]|uniref:RPA43 OB domain-containing protein n=1 Tax=Hesseltinella vesiculosa TaxID=101127 RepID=A0A1X2G8Q3_9FUNG|nr:hypothetical protein DM01DRAFT_1309926 [Hesseltinella vesiculosa]